MTGEAHYGTNATHSTPGNGTTYSFVSLSSAFLTCVGCNSGLQCRMQYYLICKDHSLVGRMYLAYDVNNDSKRWAWISNIDHAYWFFGKKDAMLFAKLLHLHEFFLVPIEAQQEDDAA